MPPATPDRPWVLLRKGKPRMDFASCDEAQAFYLRLKAARNCDVDAALFGPAGEGWYCQRWRSARWTRDDDARRRAAAERDIAEPVR